MSRPPEQPPRPSGPSTPTPPSPRPRAVEVLYPVAEIAEVWRCSRKHVYALISAGHLRTVQVGMGRAKTRIPASAVEEFIASHTDKRTKAA